MSNQSLEEKKLIRIFRDPETDNTTEKQAIKLLSQFPNPAAIKNIKEKSWRAVPVVHSSYRGLTFDPRVDFTLLHYACYNKWYKVVRLLLKKYKCEPDAKDKDGLTPLYWACMRHNHGDDIRIVRYLIRKHHCDSESKTKYGWTPLHVACRNDHLDVVKYLVTECNCDPLRTNGDGDTPLSLACSRGHYDVVSLLLTTGKLDKTSDKKLQSGRSDYILQSLVSYRRNHPFYPAFKVFVVGNQSAGKSTLVKALENRLTDTSLLGAVTGRFKHVSGVELRTAGIIPTHVHSPQLGHIIIYDFAGQYEYYSSHAAYLENLVSSPGVLFLLVVNISKDTEEIVRTLQYWTSFIANLCNQCVSMPEIVVVGSHADVVKSQGEQASEKLSVAYDKLHSSLTSSLKESKLVLNCTQAASSSLSSVSSIIATSSQTFQKQCKVSVQVHILNGVIKQQFGIATTFLNISKFLLTRKNSLIRQKHLLPSDDAILSKHLSTLSEHGQLLYLRNDENIHDSWVILNKELLLSQVNGAIFAPEYFKQHHDISSSTGVVPLSEIKKIFPDHNPQMIAGFLTHLEFCHQIGESEASLISRGHLQSSDTQSESYYFFPALVSEERPEESCKSIVQAGHKTGWCLQRIQEEQFFTSRFLHVLLLQLSFRFALVPDSPKEETPCPVVQRECNVWKSGLTDGGIHWLTMDGVEAIVEVVEQCTAVTVVVGCQEGGEMASVELRSDLIKTVLNVKEKYSGAVEVQESLISPSELESYPLKSPKIFSTFSIEKIATAVSAEKKFATRKQGPKQESIPINDLLYFEPFSSLSTDILKELFEESNDKKELDVRFLKNFGEAMQDYVNNLQQILHVKAKALKGAVHSSPSSVRDDPAHHCYLVLKIWKEQGHRSYGDLRSTLSKFSVFCGRNPLVSCRNNHGVSLLMGMRVTGHINHS